jgi:uncharacterized protein
MVPGPAFRSAVVCLPLFVVLLAAVPQPAPVSAQEKAARELFRMVGGEKLALGGAEAMMGVIRSDPELAPYEHVFRAWYLKMFAEADLEPEMVKLYMETFSEKELQEITAFYKTPVGRKAIAAMPELMRRGAELGMKRAHEHEGELQAMLDKAQEKHESEPAANDWEAQKRTVADIRDTGTAMFSWLTDQVGAAAAGQSQTEKGPAIVDLKRYPRVSREQLEKLLVPDYAVHKVPATDGWGHPLEYYLNIENTAAPQVMGIRSPGRDGKFSAGRYTVSAFDPGDFDEDIVWADGFFVRWPQRK